MSRLVFMTESLFLGSSNKVILAYALLIRRKLDKSAALSLEVIVSTISDIFIVKLLLGGVKHREKQHIFLLAY